MSAPLQLLLLLLFTTLSTTTAQNTKRVVNGEFAQVGQFPFAAALLVANRTPASSAYLCAGFVLTDAWLATSAHCCQRAPTTRWKHSSTAQCWTTPRRAGAFLLLRRRCQDRSISPLAICVCCASPRPFRARPSPPPCAPWRRSAVSLNTIRRDFLPLLLVSDAMWLRSPSRLRSSSTLPRSIARIKAAPLAPPLTFSRIRQSFAPRSRRPTAFVTVTRAVASSPSPPPFRTWPPLASSPSSPHRPLVAVAVRSWVSLASPTLLISCATPLAPRCPSSTSPL
jgi:hypothetical protein